MPQPPHPTLQLHPAGLGGLGAPPGLLGLGVRGEQQICAQTWQVFAQLFVLHLNNTVEETAQTRQCHWHLGHTVLLAPGSMWQTFSVPPACPVCWVIRSQW